MAANSGKLNGTNPPAQAGGLPRLAVHSQYLKDLSFENPNAPQILTGTQKPEIGVRVDVEVRPVAEAGYEITLKLNVEAKQGDKVSFIAEMAYAGLFAVEGATLSEQQKPFLLVEGARLLFPFARAILANTTRDGGFPPLMLGPIDFADMFRKGQTQTSSENRGETANA
ncbi:MAG: protein-export chaperone SecB [Pseudomonadota bacterium]|nr:protein-export chaperone SecB [Pseudomonadota bacterium]